MDVGAIYEVQCSQLLLAELNKSENAPSIDGQYHELCQRHFFLQDETAGIFQRAKQMLQQCEWDKLGDHKYSLDFKEVEIDILVHVSVQRPDQFTIGKPFTIVNPPPGQTARDAFLSRKISDHAIDPQANAYVVAECTLKKDEKDVIEKLSQMERSLAFLLARAQLRAGDECSDISIGNIVALAFLIAPKVFLQAVSSYLNENSKYLPLVCALWVQKRFYVGEVQRDHRIVSSHLRRLASISLSYSSHSRQKFIHVCLENERQQINISNLVEWDEFLELLIEKFPQLENKSKIKLVARIVDQAFSKVSEISDLVENDTFAVITTQILTIEDFYNDLRANKLSEQQVLHVKSVFESQGIVFSVLHGLTNSDLKEAGIDQLGVRKAVLQVISLPKYVVS
ncbi:hypothetical protein MIR68_012419 [Amoeboaphelidium protococcarum]|nr:hypothetical protein MIR68_012419 [Amoeboaphelidium protococcarum]